MIIGIDPGSKGAIAILSDDGELVNVYDMPTFTVGGKARLDVHEIGRIIDLFSKASVAVIEDVHAMPKQGVSSMFSFGFATGAIHGAIGANFIPIVLVSPVAWKRHFKLGKDKDAGRQLATRKWPQTGVFARKKDDGRAEAALIALYHLETRKSGGVND